MGPISKIALRHEHHRNCDAHPVLHSDAWSLARLQVDFAVALVSKEGRRTVLLERTLVPHGTQDLSAPMDLRFDARAGDRLVLSTSNPPERNDEFDLAIWEKIALE